MLEGKKDNRWCQGWKDDCFEVTGNLGEWNIYRCPCDNTEFCGRRWILFIWSYMHINFNILSLIYYSYDYM
ncbi:hypothetical protein RhiirA1_474107 [Rhizophagus irregularis]|uniref:Uncharacterized protein n=1 Tax=Rhizophagus irregularis TaxID=588596 RepID=A0A2N0QZ73_9GLOM|nr:hypothetical protein RhiirA1_474107 [Rhizophagus irregularis]